MLTKFRTFASLYRELGLRWSIFRLTYAFRLRTGLIRWQMPIGRWSDYKNLTSNKITSPAKRMSFPFVSGPDLSNVPWNPQTAVEEADRFLNGEIKYFAHEWVKTDFPPNWHKDYYSDFILSDGERTLLPQADTLRSTPSDMNRHWSQISDDSITDIKFIWEPNRFAFVYTLVRAYAASGDEKYPEAFWTLVEDWAQHNPPNTGPNWMDGQEIALRLMAWVFGYHAFLNSPTATPKRKEDFILYVAVQAERIHKNIDYAISTRSNHTISEAFGLWMIGLLFPELKYAEKYLSLGKQLLEQEAANQIFPDGSYSMYSLNYHRFILHIYLYAIRLSEIYQSPFTDPFRKSVTKSVNYLSHLLNSKIGEMPVYGSNDGALILPLNNCDFTDYRPLLQLGWYITMGERLFDPGPWDEDLFWLCGAESLSPSRRGGGGEGELSFSHGGIYLLCNANSRAVIRCTDFTSRPSHADQLHVDLWMHGHNLAIDAGTYLYSGYGIWRNGLARTSAHNTVTVDGKDQMTLVSRFTWTNWSKGKVIKHDKGIWQGEHDGYKPVSHKRSVMALEGDRWLVIDTLDADQPHRYALHWLLEDLPFEQQGNEVVLRLNEMAYKLQVGMTNGGGRFSIVRADAHSTRGWRSKYYGHKEPAISVMLEAHQPQVTFWSFFGFANDVVEKDGKLLKVNSETIKL